MLQCNYKHTHHLSSLCCGYEENSHAHQFFELTSDEPHSEDLANSVPHNAEQTLYIIVGAGSGIFSFVFLLKDIAPSPPSTLNVAHNCKKGLETPRILLIGLENEHTKYII